MQRDYSSNVPLTKVHEGGEPSEFKALFSVWERERRLPGQVKPVGNRIGTDSRLLYLLSVIITGITWCYWQGNRLAIHTSQVRVLVGNHWLVALGKILTLSVR